MTEHERNVTESLATAFSMLPDNKKEFLKGFAEGVAAMAKAKDETESKS